ncbi:MAG: biotin/lipoyl-binding protein [Calothrix sp. C42_A2020_038]|nr:biotin/lipoyl-binding protein [Calothrix sp. C42_A2020_038]
MSLHKSIHSQSTTKETTKASVVVKNELDLKDNKVTDSLEENQPNSQKNNQSNKLLAFIKKNWWLLPIIGIVLAIASLTVIRLRENSTEPTTATEIAPLSVRTTPVQQQPLQAWVSTQGVVRAVKYQHLSFQVEGDVTYLASRGNRSLRSGDRVTRGELLARVDDRELQADVQQAQAAIAEAQKQRAAAASQVSTAQAQVAQAQSQVRQAQAQLTKAITNRNLAQTELQRYQLLFNEGAVAASELDTRRNAVQDADANVQAVQAEIAAAEAQVKAARAQVETATQQLNATQSGVTTAQARLSQAQVALERASIYAPFDGIITNLNIRQGEYFSPQLVTSQLGGSYQGILERVPIVIIDPSEFEVIADIAGSSGENVSTGQTALVGAGNNITGGTNSNTNTDNQNLIAGARARGEVFAVNPAISPGGRAIEARIRLDPQASGKLRHGEQVTTWIAVAEKQNATVVPLNAVVRRNQQSYIFVVDQNKGVVQQRQVELGITGISSQEIIKGVSSGELVVTQGQNRLVDGAAVRIVGQ